MNLKCPTYKTPQQHIKQLTEENARLSNLCDKWNNWWPVIERILQ